MRVPVQVQFRLKYVFLSLNLLPIPSSETTYTRAFVTAQYCTCWTTALEHSGSLGSPLHRFLQWIASFQFPFSNPFCSQSDAFPISKLRRYPSVTESAPQAVYTGPSVESVADKNTPSSPTGGKLGAAIGVPLIVVALAIAGYVTWNRYKKRPQKKRFSAVSSNESLVAKLQ